MVYYGTKGLQEMEDTVSSRRKALGNLTEITGNLQTWISAGTALAKYTILVGPEPTALIGVVVTTGNSLQQSFLLSASPVSIPASKMNSWAQPVLKMIQVTEDYETA